MTLAVSGKAIDFDLFHDDIVTTKEEFEYAMCNVLLRKLGATRVKVSQKGP